MPMNMNHLFPPVPERPANPPEPPFDSTRDRLLDRLDTLRHEAFALQNSLFKAPREQSNRIKRLLAENSDAQAAIRDALSALGAVF